MQKEEKEKEKKEAESLVEWCRRSITENTFCTVHLKHCCDLLENFNFVLNLPKCGVYSVYRNAVHLNEKEESNSSFAGKSTESVAINIFQEEMETHYLYRIPYIYPLSVHMYPYTHARVYGVSIICSRDSDFVLCEFEFPHVLNLDALFQKIKIQYQDLIVNTTEPHLLYNKSLSRMIVNYIFEKDY